MPKKKIKKSDQAKAIVDMFDFHKIHTHMVKTNWEWFFPDEPPRVPTTAELRIRAKELLDSLKTRKLSYISTGGFLVFKLKGMLHLTFMVEHVSWDDESREAI